MKSKFNMKNGIATAVFAAVLSVMSSCSHGPAVQEFSESADPAAEINALDSDMALAVTNQVDVLAPKNFEEANDALISAKKSYDKQSKPKNTLHQVAVGRAYLRNANEYAAVSNGNLESVITARQRAMKAGALGYYLGDFKAVDSRLKGVTADIEDNDLSGIDKKRADLQASYLDLEVKSIQQASLGEARKTIAMAKDENAKKLAPRTLAIAEKSIKDTDAFIVGNPQAADQISARASSANAAADHLLKITRESKKSKKSSPEELALAIEGEQTKTAMTQEQLTEEQKTTQVLASEKMSLEAQQAFNTRFEMARAEFTESEADVYKQGNTLLIRLKALQFASGKAIIKNTNYPLLGKVQKVIKDFGNKTGYTLEVGTLKLLGIEPSEKGKYFGREVSELLSR